MFLWQFYCLWKPRILIQTIVFTFLDRRHNKKAMWYSSLLAERQQSDRQHKCFALKGNAHILICSAVLTFGFQKAKDFSLLSWTEDLLRPWILKFFRLLIESSQTNVFKNAVVGGQHPHLSGFISLLLVKINRSALQQSLLLFNV